MDLGAPAIAVIGEALIDLVDPGDDTPCLAHPGGSPLNVAIGLARLEQPTAFLGRFSADPFGTVLRNHALRSGVDLSLAVADHRPTTIALVTLVDGIADYEFSVDGTADFAWTDDDLPTLPGGVGVVHYGSLASWLAPGATAIGRRIATLHAAGEVLISYDPNVRPQLQPDPAAARTSVQEAVRHSHVVKASEDDLRWLYGDEPIETIARSWLAAGPRLVVVTRGGSGSVAFVDGHGPIARPVWAAPVVDTVGAGDAFMSGLLDGLVRRGITSPTRADDARHEPDAIAAILDEAALVAALTCSRAGAAPPRRADVAAVDHSR